MVRQVERDGDTTDGGLTPSVANTSAFFSPMSSRATSPVGGEEAGGGSIRSSASSNYLNALSWDADLPTVAMGDTAEENFVTVKVWRG